MFSVKAWNNEDDFVALYERFTLLISRILYVEV